MQRSDLESKWWYRLFKVLYLLFIFSVIGISFIAINVISREEMKFNKPIKTVEEYNRELECVRERDSFEQKVCYEMAKLRHQQDIKNSVNYKWVTNWEKFGYYSFLHC